MVISNLVLNTYIRICIWYTMFVFVMYSLYMNTLYKMCHNTLNVQVWLTFTQSLRGARIRLFRMESRTDIQWMENSKARTLLGKKKKRKFCSFSNLIRSNCHISMRWHALRNLSIECSFFLSVITYHSETYPLILTSEIGITDIAITRSNLHSANYPRFCGVDARSKRTLSNAPS